MQQSDNIPKIGNAALSETTGDVLRKNVEEVLSDRWDGFALIVYKRGTSFEITTKTFYYCNDPLDIFRLPEMARHKLDKVIMDSATEE